MAIRSSLLRCSPTEWMGGSGAAKDGGAGAGLAGCEALQALRGLLTKYAVFDLENLSSVCAYQQRVRIVTHPLVASGRNFQSE